MIGKLIILCAVLVALWAGISRLEKALGIGPFSRTKRSKPKPKPLFTFAGFAVTRFEAIMSGLFALYLLWGLAQIL